MIINQIHHIAIATTDIERSIKFYSEVLGLKLQNRVDMGENELVYMGVSNGFSLELVNWKGKCIPKTAPALCPGVAHFAFDVDDMKAWSKKISELGVTVELPLTNLPLLKKDCMLIKDPDGTVIELCADEK